MARPTDERRIQRAYVRRLLALVKDGEVALDPATNQPARDPESGEVIRRAPSAALLKEARTYLQCRGLIRTVEDDQTNAAAEQVAKAVRQIEQARQQPTDHDEPDDSRGNHDRRPDDEQPQEHQHASDHPDRAHDRPEDRPPELDPDQAEQLREKRDNYRAAGIIYPEEWDAQLTRFDRHQAQHEHDDQAELTAA